MTNPPETTDRGFVAWGAGHAVASRAKSLALVLLTAVILGQQWQHVQTMRHVATLTPVVVTLEPDGIGGTAVDVRRYSSATLKATDGMAQHFLSRFTELYFSRWPKRAAADYANATLFLSDALARQADEDPLVGGDIKAFERDGGRDAVDAHATKVSFRDLQTQDGRLVSGRATIDFEKRYLSPVSQALAKTEHYTADVAFSLPATVTNEFVPVNPIGLRIVALRVYQSFE